MLAVARSCYGSGLLQGDLNGVQEALLGLILRVDEDNGWLKVRRVVDGIQDAVDFWLQVEHPDIWREVEKARFPEPVAPPQEIVGDDMEDIIRQVMASF